jgi:hypothetical protein
LAEADATIDTLRRDVTRLEEENSAMVHQIVELSRELQEARDSEAEARVLRRQCVQMFRMFSARLMEATNRLGIHGLTLPTVPEDDGSIIHFFSQLAEKLAEASAKVLELVDAECRELLGLAGTQIFSNLQRLRPDIDLEEVLRGERLRRPALMTARCRTGRPGWTSPCSAYRPSTPAQERPQPRARRAPPATTPRAPGSPVVKKPRRLAATVRRSPVERPPWTPARAPAMTRAPRKMPHKLCLQSSPFYVSALGAHLENVRHCPAGPF